MFAIRTVRVGTTTATTVTAKVAIVAHAAAAATKRTHKLMLNAAVQNGYAQELCFPHGLNAPFALSTH